MKGLAFARRVLARAKWLTDARERNVRRVMAQKQVRAASPHAYVERPDLSLVVRSTSPRVNVRALVDHLRQAGAQELIVFEDGSTGAPNREWHRRLTRPNEFFVRFNDHAGTPAVERAVRLSRARVVVLLEDGDLAEPLGEWVREVPPLFERYPKLAILGTADVNEVLADLTGAGVPVPFVFKRTVSSGPAACRRDVLMTLSAVRADVGRDDNPDASGREELCLRAWEAGWQVGCLAPVASGQPKIRQPLFAQGPVPMCEAVDVSPSPFAEALSMDSIDSHVEELNRNCRTS